MNCGGIWLGEGGSCDDCPASCMGDTDGNGVVNIEDLLNMLGSWGAGPYARRPQPGLRHTTHTSMHGAMLNDGGGNEVLAACCRWPPAWSTGSPTAPI